MKVFKPSFFPYADEPIYIIGTIYQLFNTSNLYIVLSMNEKLLKCDMYSNTFNSLNNHMHELPLPVMFTD
jgi:hypothetical protein